MKALDLVLIFIGGGLGSVGRYSISQLITYKNFPLATFVVNIVGSFIIGFLLSSSISQNQNLKLLLAIGFCGGFTTFSSFSAEVIQLIQQQKNWLAIFYIAVSVCLSLIFTCLGMSFFTGNK